MAAETFTSASANMPWPRREWHGAVEDSCVWRARFSSSAITRGRRSGFRIMELPTILVFTHDAMGDGEDGPTHQPVEHLASLRAIPGLSRCAR